MQSRSTIALGCVLKVMRPLAGLLLRHGVGYPAFAAALKQVFLSAAADELQRLGRKQTDSALSLLSGVHRRDVRNLARLEPARLAMDEPMNLASQVASRWLTDPQYLDRHGRPLALPRTGAQPSFDTLAAEVSSDVRPRAILDELVRLGMAGEDEGTVRLLAPGFVPRGGLAEMSALFSDNLHDHAAAAVSNIEGDHNYLEQAIFSDELTPESVRHLRSASTRVWREAFNTVMRETQARFDHDRATSSPGQRNQRIRFGVYFYACDEHERPS
jgi:hypothetical protein